MRQTRRSLLLCLTLVFVVSTVALAQSYKYKVKHPHMGGDITPTEAYEMVLKNPERTFLVDCRTRAEYQIIGHPEGAYNIPYTFWTGNWGGKKYGKEANPNFGKNLLARFNPKADTLIIFCRSASRSCKACNEAVKAGWPEDKVFNVLGGFEGDKVKYKKSAYHGQRKLGGWRNEGLPWTYHMDKKLVYQPDLAS
ncbi:MAG: rhodanese-like domain-containing protein [Deltaproteobacteria bacterium]|nr:MAG: rhodanese-like domain-containing protein [Deltaproteobacteria bacterium]